MNPRTTAVLALVALALGAFVYFYEIEGGRARQEAEERARQLFPEVEADDVTEIRLTTSDGAEATLSRGEEGFRLTEPLEFPADAFAADGLASGLADLAREASLEDPLGPEEYGLGEEARVLRFRAGGAEHVLRIGDTTPVGSNTYVTVEGREDVFTVPTFEVRSLDKSLDDLREKRILDFDRTAIRRVSVRWPDGSVELERAPADGSEADEGGSEAASEWRVVSPVEGPADDEVVGQLLSDLSFLRANGFVDDPPGDAEAGLDPPAFEVVLTGAAPAEGGEADVHRLAVGAAYEGDRRLVRAGRPSLYTIPAVRLDDFPRRVVAYRYRQLTDYAMADAARVDLFFHPPEGDPVSVTAELGENAWRSSPEHVPSGRIARLVSELSSLKADDILMDEATESDLERLGLSPPNTIVTVLGRRPEAAEGEEPPAAPRLAELHIGEVSGSEWIDVRVPGDPAVYRLDYEIAEHVPVALDAFRNRFVADEPPARPPEPPVAPEAAPGELLTPSEESP